MRHRILFSIELAHGYVAGGLCPSFGLTPTPETAGRLAGRRLLTRGRRGAVDILAQVDGEGRPFIAMDAGLVLDFELAPTDAGWAHYTDVSAFRAFERPSLRAPGTVEGGAEVVLELGEGEEHQGAPARGALARVEIAAPADAWTDAPPRFRVELAPTSARWAYYYVSDAYVSDAARELVIDLAIDDGDPERAAAPLVFEVESADADMSAHDRVAADLERRYPDSARYRLLSTQALACSDQPRRHLALRADEDVLVTELPNPALANQSTVSIGGQAQDTLFRVLKF